MPRPAVAVALLATAGLLPLAAVALGWVWYVDGPLMVLLPLVGGYAAGAWLPRTWALAGGAAAVTALVAANQLHDDSYHWLDDLVFFLVVVGGPAVAGAAVTTRARQVRRLTALQDDLEELQRIEVAAARLDEHSRVSGEVHSRLAEQIAGIALRAEGARAAKDSTALAAIEAEARSVLDRLRESLGSMRTDERPGPSVDLPRRPVPRPSLLDLLVPAAIGVAMAVETAVISDARGPAWANTLAALAVVAPLVARRRRPILAAGASVAAGTAMSATLTPIPETVTGVALLVVLFYSVGAWCRGWWWLPGWALVALGTVGMEQVSAVGSPTAADDRWIVLLWTVGAVAVGRITAGWQDRVRRTTAVVDALERGRDAAVRLAVAQEREALAAELHDTVAHAMTAVCLQAGAHQHPGADPDAALQVIASVAESSLVELREGLEALESAADPLAASRIAALGRRLGVDVRVSVDGDATGPAAVLAHRVVREAVVNVARHAPGARAAVRIRQRGPDDLWVEVVDDGSDRSGVLTGTGTGLRGLAETLASQGGTLEWGRLQPRGFRVAALVPGLQHVRQEQRIPQEQR